MKTIKKTIKKILLIAVISLEIVLLSVQPTQAGLFGGGSFKLPSVNEVLTQVERRYHINQGSVQDFSEGFNVSSQKTIAPEVKISFSPAKPKLGEKVTATALPTNFQDGEKDLYFNWYLKHAICDETGSPNAEQRRLCDADNDGNVEPNDWKITAMRIVANNNFDITRADYSRHSDDDGYATVTGGNHNIQNNYCYVHDYISGTDYEVRTVRGGNNSSSVACTGSVVCGSQDTRTCLGGSFTSDPNIIGTGSTGAFNMPDIPIVSNSGESPYCDPNVNMITCPTGTTPMCVTDTRYVDPTCDFIASLADLTPLVTANSANTSIACTSNVGLAGSSGCGHQFPVGGSTDVGDGNFNLRDEVFWRTDPNNPNTSGNGNLDEANVAGLGINAFSWDYLPGDKVGVIVEGSSFIGTKHDDSSKQITFALPNNIFDGHGSCQIENRSSYTRIIRGYPVTIPAATINFDNCLEYNLVDPANGDFASILDTELSYYPTNPNVGGVGINQNGSAGDVLTVTANTSNLDTDNKEVYYKWSVFGTTRAKDDISLLTGTADGWQELSDSATFRENNGIELLEGLGMSEFKMQLNNLGLSGITFLRVFVEVEEFHGRDSSGSSGKASTGRDNTIIQVNNSSSNNGIDLIVGATTICNSASGPATCEVLNNQVITARLRNGADVRNYLWTLNGKEITYLTGTDISQGNEIRFLVQGDLGETFVLNLVANDTAKTDAGGANSGEKLNLTRNLVIVQSMVGLGPNNELNRGIGDTCGTLGGGSADIGTYNTISVAADGTMQTETLTDCSETVYDATGGVDVPITYYPSFIGSDGAVATYYVNGVDQGTNNHVDLSSFLPGSMVTVTVKAQYSPVRSVADLASDWGVSQIQSSTPEEMSDTIYIRVGEAAVGANKSSKIIAGLAYNLPTQMIFILRIMLSALVIVFTSGVLMSLSKKRYNN